MLYYALLGYNTDIKNLASNRSFTDTRSWKDGQVYSTKGCNSFYFVTKA